MVRLNVSNKAVTRSGELESDFAPIISKNRISDAELGWLLPLVVNVNRHEQRLWERRTNVSILGRLIAL